MVHFLNTCTVFMLFLLLIAFTGPVGAGLFLLWLIYLKQD